MSFGNTKTPLKPTSPAKWQIPMRPHPTKGVMEYCLEGELKEQFCKLFPKNSNRRMMTWFGISSSTLQRFRRLRRTCALYASSKPRTRRRFVRRTAITPLCEASLCPKPVRKEHES